MKISGKYLSCTFCTSGSYIVCYDRSELIVYEEKSERSIMSIYIEGVNGAVYDGKRLLYTCDNSADIFVLENNHVLPNHLCFIELKLICVVKNCLNQYIFRDLHAEGKQYYI